MVRRTSSQFIMVVALGGAALFVGSVGFVGSTAVQAAQATASQCVAIVLPSVGGTDTSAAEMPQAIRELLVSYLSGPGLRSIPLEARLVTQAREEAKRKACDHFLNLMSFEYQLETKGAEPAGTAKVSAKAKTDGEDLVTPLAEQVATAVA